ncbi:MAG TPA: TIGR04283 family arsenosugar biosynthesis glycosyltransferase [Elainellaceae cyanobacterium]
MPTTARLIVFTRYPEPGKTKTRLIPALGAEGAANLQRQMTEHTMQQIQLVLCQCSVGVEVRFSGGDQYLMADWLGEARSYHSQGDGDLGCRMEAAFRSAFDAGMTRVVMIGIDCPWVNADILMRAFDALRSHDVVLGPATDGGYYLIGLRCLIPELFRDIPWSTDKVFQQSMDIAHRQGRAIAILDSLTDVDRPEDLWVWDTVSSRQALSSCQNLTQRLSQNLTQNSAQNSASNSTQKTVSVIMPVLNEEHTISHSVVGALAEPNIEVIVVDGGSRDRTIEVAQVAGAIVMFAPAGRASQMNVGAQTAQGDILLFLHADTRLPDGFAAHIRQILAKPGVVAGAFQLRIDGTAPGLSLIEWGVKWRSRLFQLPYGDQAIFLESSTFQRVGGFPDLPIMEDFELIRRLRSLGTIAIAPSAVITSGRRWDKLGVLKTTVINQLIIVAYLLGMPIDRIARWYRCDR